MRGMRSRLGKNGRVDPTWQQFPADVTHIALAKGGLQAQSTLWSLMGRLSVTVID